jgi:hypothetical protein
MPYLRRRPGPLRVAMTPQAGSWAAAGGVFRALTRPPSPPITQFLHPVTVDIGNDGISPQVTFPASGTVQAQAGPQGVGASWSLAQATMSTSIGPLDTAEAALYVGPAALPQYLIAGNLQGGLSQYGLGGLGIPAGWFVIAVWTGGTTGATASLIVTGAKTVLDSRPAR